MKKYLKYILLVLFLLVLGWFTYSVFKDYNKKKEVESRIQTLPNAKFLSLNQQTINLMDFNEEMPLVLIYFHSECEYCQYEAQEIGQNAIAFENCQLVMITSDDSIPRVEDFCNKHHLWELENFEVLLDLDNQFKRTFGKAIIPSVYIYGADRKFKKYFLGETKPQAIISAIKK